MENDFEIFIDESLTEFETQNGQGGTLEKISEQFYKLNWNDKECNDYMDLDLNFIHYPKYSVKYEPHEKNTDYKIVCVMTSWKPRINSVASIISFFLKTQNIKPDKFILYLSSNEFEGREETLPDSLITLEQIYDYFEIVWIKENYKTCKKLLYQPKENEYLVIMDDDLYYFPDFLEKLIEYEKKFKCPVFFSSHMHYFRDPQKTKQLRNVPNFEHWGFLSGTIFTKDTYPYNDIQKYCFDKSLTLNYLNISEESFILAFLIKNDQKSICILDCNEDQYSLMHNDVTLNNAMIFVKGTRLLNTIKEYPHARIEMTFVELYSLIKEYPAIHDAYARNFPDFLKICIDYEEQITVFKDENPYSY